MDKYQKALNTLKTSDIKLYVYKEQESVAEEYQPTIFDFYHSEIFILQELVEKYNQLLEKNKFLKSIHQGQQKIIREERLQKGYPNFKNKDELESEIKKRGY